MPYVNVRVLKNGVTRKQKAQIIAEITQTLVSVLGKKPEHTHVVIDEVELDNWGFAGQLTSDLIKQAAAADGGGTPPKTPRRGAGAGSRSSRRR